MPSFSIVIPIYPMKNWDFYLKRCLNSIYSQTFTDYEIIITMDGKMAENTNSGIRKAKGKYIKILFMDDYLAHENALQELASNLTPEVIWAVTGCNHDPSNNPHIPYWTDEVKQGVNTIGSPSVLLMQGDYALEFDDNLTWVLDCELYGRLFDAYGPPHIIQDINVTIGLHEGQATNILSDELKINEQNYLYEKYTAIKTDL